MKRRINVLSRGFLAGLLLSAFWMPSAQAQEKSPAPEGKWVLTKVDRVATNGNSYCTLSHKYADNLVVSLGRNLAEEYSLAVDFQKPVFKKGEAMKISLQPGPGQNRSYDLMPASEKALVIRLGWDSVFFKTLDQTQSLGVAINDQSYKFALPDVVKGQSDLKGCMEELKVAAASMNGGGTAQTKDVLTAQAGVAPAAGFTAEKQEESKTSSKSNLKPAKVEEKVAAASASMAPAAQEVPAQKSTVAAQDKQAEKADKIDQALAAQNAKLEADLQKALAQSKSMEAQLASVQKSMADTKALQDKIAKLEVDVAAKDAENKAMKSAAESSKNASAAQAQTQAQQTAEMDQIRAQNKVLNEKIISLEKSGADVAALQQKLSAMESDAAAKDQAMKAIETAKAQGMTQAQAETAQKDAALQAMRAENAALQAKLKEQDVKLAEQELKLQDQGAKLAALPAAPPAASAQEKVALAEKTAELESIKIENKAMTDKLAKLQAEMAAKPAAPEPSQQMADAQAKIKELEIRNQQLEDTVKKSQIRIAEAAVSTESKSIKQIAELEAKLAAAQTDNNTLARQLESTKLQQEDKRLNVIAGDWDLEKATKRFNEAEREIQRLGLELERERTSCNMEKAKIEDMLFSPAVTEQKQIEKLTQLERENEDLRRAAGLAAPARTSILPSVSKYEPAAMAPVASAAPASTPSVISYLSDIDTAAGGNVLKLPATNTAPAMVAGTAGKDIVGAVLAKAGIQANGLKASNVQGEESVAWSAANGVKGAAMVSATGSKTFDQSVQSYLAQQKAGCPGDFASMPSPPSSGATGPNMSMYEVACVTGKTSQSSSVLFYEQDGKFVAISNQADASMMGAAMDNRDRIASAVRGM